MDKIIKPFVFAAELVGALFLAVLTFIDWYVFGDLPPRKF